VRSDGRWIPPASGILLRSAGGSAFPPDGPSVPRGSSLDQDSTTPATDAVPRTDDDRSIVAAVLAGDRDAFRVLVEREGPTVVRACARIIADRAEAEDLAQEAFVIAFRSLPTWRGDGPLGAWVTRIAVRLALRQAARLKSVAWLDPFAAESERATAAEGVRLGTTEAPDPASWAIRAERDTELRRAVANLDEPYREVVALRFFGELSLHEIAASTARPLGTVKTHLHRGLARLRAALEADPR
jgi:RNA polymerase sigma-70 factor, ECF subfamily